MPALPTGTVTFLFTDVEGSTKLLHELGAERYAEALLVHRRELRKAFAAHGGVEVDTEGDAFFVAFPSAPGALAAAAAAQAALAGGPIRVRMGIHTGTPHAIDGGYVGMDVHRGARIAAAGHGGQVLVSSATVALTGTDGLRDLGPHRLKDLAAPERIWQLGDRDFPPLKSLHQTNLPIAPTAFIGRERELGEVASLLADSARVVTLTGPGGTGKTRLAMQAAAEAAERYPQGVWWVPLEAVRAPELVLSEAASAVGAKTDLAEHIADKRMLLAFDNFEQVIPASGEVASLLATCPHLVILATSREPLRIRGEREYAVPPLARQEGVALFVQRAREHGRDVAVDEDVSLICHRLDDLPLAIELAAARVKVLAPAQIAKRLEQRLPLLTSGARDLPARQRTLRGAIEWSHELLSPEEQRLFARLAVFRGGWTLEAAEAVCDADLDTLQSLVDKSLVRAMGERFTMLETIREYATERLEASDERDDVRRRHAAFFLAFAEEAEPHTRAYFSEREWFDRLEHEHDNLRVALERLETTGASQPLLQLAGALSGFWGSRGFAQEGSRWLHRALSADNAPTHARARALVGAADLGVASDARQPWAEQALELHRMLGSDRGKAEALWLLASDAAERQEFERARELAQESRRICEEIGFAPGVAAAAWVLAWAHSGLGDAARGRELYEEAAAGARSTGMEWLRSLALYSLSGRALKEGRPADAIPLVREAFAVAREMGDPTRMAFDACRLAAVLLELGHLPTAVRLLSSGKRALEDLGRTSVAHRAAEDDNTLTRLRAGLGHEAFEVAWAAGRELTPDEAITRAFDSLE